MRGTPSEHLSLTNDTILFTSGRAKSLQFNIQTLRTYEDTYGQWINCEKSHFMVHQSVFDNTKDRIKRITRLKKKQGITTYLGCPLFVGRTKNSYFSDLVSKVITE